MLEQILNPLPLRPYCTDDLSSGLSIRALKTALNLRYMQINPPSQQHYLIFDVDRESGAFAWEESGLAPPNYCAINPDNGHAHLVYKLAEPVATSENARLEPLRYLASVERGYRIELGADAGYSGLITRNPYKNQTMCIHTHEYDLFELSDWLKHGLSHYSEREIVVSGIGRNVELFDTVRAWAYRNIRLYRVNGRSRLFSAWHSEVFEYALGINAQFNSPLPHSEIKATAKSIAKYCWKYDAQAEKNFSEKQAIKGRLGGIASGITRAKANEDKRIQARLLSAQGLSQRVIAQKLGVSKSSVGLWLQKSQVSNEA